MPDLVVGEVVQVQGSATRPYQIKNVGGVYSCSCPAWRNQSLPIDRRTCKHIRELRGEEAEKLRSGVPMAGAPRARTSKFVPPLLLAETWNESIDPTGWWLSEKLDGVRAYWDGKQFLSRQGNRYHAPDWFTQRLPLEPLDGELWLGRKQFQRTVSIVRREDAGELWKAIRFVVFDAPAEDGVFERRMVIVRLIMEQNQPPFAQMHWHSQCRSRQHLQDELSQIQRIGGEGLMLRRAGSGYNCGRSQSLLKVKRFRDAEARVVGHEPGRGRHKGRLGALLVRLADGVAFAVGSGLTDAERANPPPVGSIITFQYQELSDGGVPRFPTYGGIRPDAPLSHYQGDDVMSQTTTKRFEFVEGTSSKFWQIGVSGANVHIRFGRIGTDGQAQTKNFPDENAASKHAEKVIRDKLAKGYTEVAA